MTKNYFFSKLKLQRLLIIIMILANSFSYAQDEKLLSKNSKIRKVEIQKFYKKLESINDNTVYFGEIKKLKDFAKQHNDVELELEADFIEINRMVFLNTKSAKFKPEEILKRCDEVFKKATKNNLQDMKLRVLWRKGNYCWCYLCNYEMGFETYFIMDKELSKLQPNELAGWATYINTIGEAYYFFQDYEKAKEHFKKGLLIPENKYNSSDINLIINNLGLSYEKLNKLDSAEYFFKKVIACKPARNSELWKYLAKGNLAHSYYLEKQYEKALPLLLESINGAIKVKEYGNVSGSLIPLADIYLKNGRINEAGVCLKKARKLITFLTGNEDKQNRLALFYPMMSKWCQKSGEKDLAIQYLDSAIVTKEIHDKKFSVLQLLRAQQKNDLQEHRLATLELFNEEQKKTSQRNIILLMLASLIVGFSLVYYFQKNRFKREKRIQNLNLTITNQQLQMATQQLQDFTNKLHEKNNIIELLQKQTDNEADNEALEQIKKSTILTSDDWDNFQSLFENVHAGFLHRLTTKYKELTASEIRYITLAKLNLSQKEMANILGISPNSVRVTWHRVSKKLNLSDKDTLENLLVDM